MRLRTVLITASLTLTALGVAFAQLKPFREYPGREYEDFQLPEDYKVPAEWVFARLMYPEFSGDPPPYAAGYRYGYGGFRRRYGGNWKQGRSAWTTDYPRADRHLAVAMRRLSRIDTRSVEQPVDLDDVDDVFNYPWLYAVEVGQWELTDQQAKKMREYLDRGGFFMCDDFHGGAEFEIFERSMRRVFPERAIVDIPKNDPIFHAVYDLNDMYQIPGAQYLRSGRLNETFDGSPAHWRGIYDDKGRLVVAICHNVDMGDSWEWADDPAYDEKFSALSFRIAVNYVTYSMTH
jgi:hypothetical protein